MAMAGDEAYKPGLVYGGIGDQQRREINIYGWQSIDGIHGNS
jgi:hypothetical protein